MDGILVVNKPQGMTSNDVVDLIRRRFDIKKVGHAGTLDPMATGALVILIGKYTKSSSEFMGDDKEYQAELTLGAVSDTLDAWGKVVSSGKEVNFKAHEIEAAFKKFLGNIEQTPPAYSAVKYKGKKLYELARKGISVKVEPRRIFIKDIEIQKIDLPKVKFKAACSKGTYIRRLASDIGNELGCGAYLSGLERTRSGRFIVSDSVGMDALRTISREDLAKRLIV